MKRLLTALRSDILYQWRYGFYFIYMFLVACFIAVLRLIPEDWRQTTLVLTLLSDPALLGFFFIGGILQLERGEGLLDALFLSPLRPHEYLISKALSLGLISTAAALLIAIGSGLAVSYALLLPAVLIASMCFTLIGVSVSVNLRSMNTFLSIDGLWEVILLAPPLLLILGINFFPLELFPGGAALRIVQVSAGLGFSFVGHLAIIVVWLGIAFWFAHTRLTAALCRLGGAAQ